MKIEFINNAGITSLKNEFEKEVKCCINFNIASAFVTKEAVDILKIFLKSNKNRKGVGRFITGLYHCFNSKEVLLELNKLAKLSKGKLQIKISKKPNFHWKYYDFHNLNYSNLYIGSANFTDSGLTKTGEIQTKITISIKDTQIKKQVNDLFNKEWEDSIDISQIPLDKYRENILKVSKSDKLDTEISKLLFSKQKKEIFETNALPTRVVTTHGQLLKSTMKLVDTTQTHWEKNGWEFFSLLIRREYDQYSENDILLLISKTGSAYRFQIILVVDKCLLKTNEGNYFIAYKGISRVKKETQKIKSDLFEAKINYRSRKNIDRKINKKQLKSISDLFI